MDAKQSYNPQDFERKIYETWEHNGYFIPKIDKKLDPFSIVMPPPNITGQLHMGHALDNSIQDVIIRFKRMQGFSTLWVPGTDHASIATEVKIIQKLESEGITKQDLGREKFLERAWEWKKEYGGAIVKQMRYLGLSCDWSRETFTMDEKCSKAVMKVFTDLYNKKLIYRGDRIINWCPCCRTALSDAEVEYVERPSHLWHVRYPFVDGTGAIIIATTRPETILGDTAVAVNPKDKRYEKFVGKMLKLPLTDKEIPIIADDYVEMDFGSGAVKITPAHDPNDFEVGLRHNLEVIRIMDDGGVMNENANAYKGLKREEARKRIIEDLVSQGYMVKIEDYAHNVGECYRCHTIIEPIVSKQWFVKMKPLAKPAIDVVKKKKIKFVPERFSKTYFNWMENIKDWCISRQLWWGHRIPAYYCDECGELIVQEEMPKICPKCGCTHFKQDEDVLDTWFSSALWPFSTLGYPELTQDLKYYYPTSILVTGYDIIFFWVARMIFSGLEHMQDIPFSDVVIHGIVRDSQGRKMSKSLGNGVDPLPIIKKYGADSLRHSLLTGVAPGNDTRFSEEKVDSSAAFMNKIWNAARFILMNSEGVKPLKDMKSFRLTNADKWILTKLNELIRDVTNNLNKYELGLALQKAQTFFWSEYCDWYLELVKNDLRHGDKLTKQKTVTVLKYTLNIILQLFHPFIPFITEELYLSINKQKQCKSIMLSEWPVYNKSLNYKDVKNKFEGIIEIIKSIRNIKAEMKVAPSKKITLIIIADTVNARWLKANADYITSLANLSSIEIFQNKEAILEKCSTSVVALGELLIPMGELIDKDKEIERLAKEREVTISEIQRSERMLSNEGFVAKAPKNLIDSEKNKLSTNKEKLTKIEEQLNALKK